MQARWMKSLKHIEPSAWDALHDGKNPFVHYAFLSGLEQAGCLRTDWGWTPHHLTLWDGKLLIAAAPGYIKSNSHGEFVFDHAWASAYAHYGQHYYPKWLCAVPYSPVTGPRLLTQNKASCQALLQAICEHVNQHALSSAHVNFHTAFDDAAFNADWLERVDIQYQWNNKAGWNNFEDFLAAMNHKHRKNIRQERAKVTQAGVHFRIVHGDEASHDDLQAMYGFYLQTFHEYGNAPALTLEFFQHLTKEMPRALVIFFAEHQGQPVAGALCLRGGSTLYGRYWGANTLLPGLHFETCYYQGIDYCLREGLTHFEPGAQGTHKIARGFLPTSVRSRHWIANVDFRKSLEHWCDTERALTRQNARALALRSPFRDHIK